MKKINYRESSSPLQVIVKNGTNETKQISLFGSEYNEFENSDIESYFSNISYSSIQKTLLHTIYGIDKMRIHLQTKNSKGNFDTKKSKYNLKDLVISINYQDINGQSLTMPLAIEKHIYPKQFQKNIADVKHEIYLDGSVALNFTLSPKTEIVFTLFPFYKNKLGTEAYYGERGLIKMIEDVKHPFSEILVNKINEANRLRNSYKADEEENAINSYYSSSSKMFFNEKIHTILIGLNDIPSDLYRNMVNLYVELEDYINALIKEAEDFIDNLDAFELDLKNNHEVLKEINELKNKTEDVLYKRKISKKQVSKKENKEALDVVSKKVNNKKSPTKKVVKKVTKKVSKK